MKFRNVLLLVSIVLIVGCARYHTRIFEVNEASIYKKGFVFDVFGEVCGKYLIHPDIWAFQGSSRIDTDSLYSFSIYLRINDTSGTDIQVSADQIREVISIDSMKVIFNASSVEIWKSPVHEGLLRGNGNPGLSYYFGDITIPSEIDSITVLVPISNRELDRDNLIGCDTLVFYMHRKESSSIGPLLN